MLSSLFDNKPNEKDNPNNFNSELTIFDWFKISIGKSIQFA
jgi:hypothetical protein